GVWARLSALARLPVERVPAGEGVPLVRRVLEPRRGGADRRRDARRLRRRAVLRRRAALAAVDGRAHVRGDLRAGPAGGGHGPLPPEPVARSLALPALDGDPRARGGRAARGLAGARRAGAGARPPLR